MWAQGSRRAGKLGKGLWQAGGSREKGLGAAARRSTARRRRASGNTKRVQGLLGSNSIVGKASGNGKGTQGCCDESWKCGASQAGRCDSVLTQRLT